MNRGNLEREVKLEAGIGFRIPDLNGLYPGVSAQSEAEQHLQAIYVDTPDLRLTRSGLTLRHRSERSSSSPGEWTLKLPAASSDETLSRHEMNWPGKWGPVPVEISSLVRAYRRSATLGPVARLVTHRRRAVLSGRLGEPLLEIDDDVVSVMDGRRLAARFREVEVEVVGAAPVSLLHATVARLEEAGAVTGEPRPKLVRAIGYRAAEPADVVPAPIKRTASMAEVIRAAIAQGYLRLLAHDLGVRLDEDPEDVHQARVATRRLRSDLRTFRDFLPEEWTQETRAELGWVAEALGRARDADVLFERLQREVDSLDGRDAGAAASLLGKLVTERDRAHEHLMEVFGSSRYAALLDRLVLAAAELPPRKWPAEVAEHAVAAPFAGIASPSGAPVQPPNPSGPTVQPANPSGATAPAIEPAVEVGTQPAVEVGTQPAVQVGTQPADVGVQPAAQVGTQPAADVGIQPAADVGVQPAADGAASPLAPIPAAVSPTPGSHSSRADREGLARDLAPSVVMGPWRHVVRGVSALGANPTDAALHEIRIRAKRLRYACEAVAEVVGKPAVDMARAAADLQGVLGDFHDAVVAEEWLRAASVDASPAQALAAGQLIARQREDAARCRTDWPDSWKRLHRKKQRAWLR